MRLINADRLLEQIDVDRRWKNDTRRNEPRRNRKENR